MLLLLLLFFFSRRIKPLLQGSTQPTSINISCQLRWVKREITQRQTFLVNYIFGGPNSGMTHWIPFPLSYNNQRKAQRITLEPIAHWSKTMSLFSAQNMGHVWWFFSFVYLFLKNSANVIPVQFYVDVGCGSQMR